LIIYLLFCTENKKKLVVANNSKAWNVHGSENSKKDSKMEEVLAV